MNRVSVTFDKSTYNALCEKAEQEEVSLSYLVSTLVIRQLEKPQIEVDKKKIKPFGGEDIQVRNRRIMNAHLYGYSNVAISEKEGLTQGRISQILSEMKREESNVVV